MFSCRWGLKSCGRRSCRPGIAAFLCSYCQGPPLLPRLLSALRTLPAQRCTRNTPASAQQIQKLRNGYVYTVVLEAFHRLELPWQESVLVVKRIEQQVLLGGGGAGGGYSAPLVSLNALLKQLPLPAAVVLLEARYCLGTMGKELRRSLVEFEKQQGLNERTDERRFAREAEASAAGARKPWVVVGNNRSSGEADLRAERESAGSEGKRDDHACFVYKGEQLDLRECFGATGSTSSTSASQLTGTNEDRSGYLGIRCEPSEDDRLPAPDAFTLSIVLQKLAGCTRVSIRKRQEHVNYYDQAVELYGSFGEKADLRCAMQVVRCFPPRAWRELCRFLQTVPGESWDSHFVGSSLDVIARGCDSWVVGVELAGRGGGEMDKTKDGDLIRKLLFHGGDRGRGEGAAAPRGKFEQLENTQTPLLAAASLFSEAKKAGIANTVVHNAMLLALQKANRWREALDLFAEMIGSGAGSSTETTNYSDSADVACEKKDSSGLLVDKISFGTMMATLPPGEWLLGVNLLRKMQELKFDINTQIAYAVLHLLERSLNVADRKNEHLRSVGESPGGADTAAKTMPGAGEGKLCHFRVIADGEGPAPAHAGRDGAPDVAQHTLPRALFPSTIVTAKMPGARPAWKVFFAAPGSKGSDKADESDTFSEIAGMSVLTAAPLQVGRKLLTGAFHPEKTGVPWTEGLFRTGFGLLLRDAENMAHPGWQMALRLWQTRAPDVYPQSGLRCKANNEEHLVGAGRMAMIPRHHILDFHPVAGCRDRHYDVGVVKVCLFCSLGSLEKALLDEAKRQKGTSSEQQPPRITVRLITGKGEQRLRKGAAEFLGSLRSVMPTIQSVACGHDAGNLLVELGTCAGGNGKK
eukprot:g6792.t1